jgi:2-(1,2-epoxy-1,2-dihydrophenyl)acetyl-CoA isomerase
VSVPRFQTIRLALDGDVATLTLDGPDDGNSMGPEMVPELAEAFSWLADRAPARAVVMTGSGDTFCSGGDVAYFRDGLLDPRTDLVTDVRRGCDRLHQAIVELRRIPYPVIAAVNGHAAGAGFSLALACDLRIASDRAAFVFAYGRLGASPDAGMTYFLPRIVGPARALELLLEEPIVRAPRALELGLVSEVAPREKLADVAGRRAARLAAKAPYYLRTVKRLLASSHEHGLAEHLQLERHALADSMATEDFATGITALFAGSRPQFSGR